VLERLTARVPANTVAISETTKAGLVSMAGEREITVLPIGIDIDEIDSVLPAKTRSDVLFAGRLIREKHVDVLIDAVGILRQADPGIRCLIIGDGPERINLEEKVRSMDLSDNILFTGFLPRSEDVIAHMKSSRVFVLPSTREGFGISVLEALAAGLPVVTIDHPKNASRVFTGDGCGLDSSLDARDVAEKIRTLLSAGEETRERCRIKGREYDWEAITDMIEEYYRKVGSRSDHHSFLL
jgi:glycosyltransferase involved in cell wall biosynthesis